MSVCCMSACLHVCMSVCLHVCMLHVCYRSACLCARLQSACLCACYRRLTFDRCQQPYIYTWHTCIHTVALCVKLSPRTSYFHLFLASCRERVQTLPVLLCWGVGVSMEVERGQANDGNGLSGVLGMSRAEFRYMIESVVGGAVHAPLAELGRSKHGISTKGQSSFHP